MKDKFVADDKNLESLPGTPSNQKRLKDFGNQTALAMELPFTMVGTVVFGGFIGYLLDKWLHTAPWLLLVFGGLGFFAGVREVIRRLDRAGKT
jgi:F0F1-type ATP synthase assembly protein I